MKNIEKTYTVKGKHIYTKLINPHYKANNKPLMIFLHEGLGCTAQWRDFPQKLSDATGLAAFTYDRYGYGLSETRTEEFDEKYMHEEAFTYLPELLGKADIDKKLILIGHSDGGTIALLFASKFTNMVCAVITEADHVVCENITTEGVKKIVSQYKNSRLKIFLETYHGDKTDKLFKGWSSFWLSEKAPKWHILDYLSLIQAPVLAIQGKNDNYGSFKQLALKLEKIGGNVHLFFIKDCGHIPHFEQKTIVFENILSFINKISTV